MALSLTTNISALQTSNRLQNTSATLSTAFERLSSGLRINKASDDPAGLALANSLSTEARLTGVAINNVNDGISVLNIAEIPY